MIQLPDYFVRKVSGYPAGFKLSKMTRIVEVVVPKVWTPLYGPGSASSSYQKREGDPLNGGDFRYWKAYRDSSYCLTSCRCCGSVFSYKEARKQHMSGEGRCGARLEEAYKRLKRSKTCVICELETHQKTYGLPLCGKDCVDEWDYVTATPDVLGKILKEIGAR